MNFIFLKVINQLINISTNQPFNQSVNQKINQPIIQSMNQSKIKVILGKSKKKRKFSRRNI